MESLGRQVHGLLQRAHAGLRVAQGLEIPESLRLSYQPKKVLQDKDIPAWVTDKNNYAT